MRQFVIPDKSDKTDRTSYGILRHDEWCELECKRLNKAYGQELFFVRNVNNYTAIMTTLKNREYERI